MKPTSQRTFEIRHDTLRHIANLSPNMSFKVCIAELKNTHLKMSQRAFKVLADSAVGSRSTCKRIEK